MDNTNAFGRVGEIVAPDGVYNPIRLGKSGEVAVTQAHSPNAEIVVRGHAYIASQDVAGVAPGTALGTTPPLALWNPTGSGKNLIVMKAYLGYVSGTLGAGTVCLAQVTQPAAPTTGTELVPVNALLGGPRGIGRAFTGSTVAGTPTIVRGSFVLGAFLASTAVVPGLLKDDIVGEIVVAPGNCLVMQAVAAAGTTPLTLMSITWEEVNA